MINATPTGSQAVEPGRPEVLVGVVDTGIDASHPDIAPNFDAALSRNFTEDIPLVDGPCEAEPDQSCTDPADVDEGGHGTHVAGTIAAAANGVGIAGVAPGVRLVNLRAGQDSGLFFLKPTLDAITYAADHGIDAVNLSFYTDPWLFNCRANPADSPEEQLQQATIIDATQQAVDYARARGVTVVAALGNEAIDLDNPTSDATSPDFPPGAARVRAVDNSCLSVPAELDRRPRRVRGRPERAQDHLLELRRPNRPTWPHPAVPTATWPVRPTPPSASRIWSWRPTRPPCWPRTASSTRPGSRRAPTW